jgi:signal transduction histidine kinase
MNQWPSFQAKGSLKAQVAFLIAMLSFVPNFALIAITYSLYPKRLALEPIGILGITLWILVLGVLSAGIGYGSSHYMLKPLSQLAEELQDLENRLGQMDQWHLNPKPQDPEEALILRNAFIQVLERFRLEQNRRQAFSATLMHDLKTPLLAFQYILAVLKEQPLSPQDKDSIITQAQQENERILDLVQKMVQVYRLENKELKLRRRPCNLSWLVEMLAKRMLPIAAQRRITLRTTGSGWGAVDPSEFERALYNLVDNALRYARSQVTIEVLPHQIWVIDDGPGLPAPLDELAKPYTAEPIEIAGKRYTARSSGLGLFIVQQIMQAHQGRLEVIKSDSEGTTLAMIIP